MAFSQNVCCFVDECVLWCASEFLCSFSILWFANFLSLFLDFYAPWTTHPSVHVCLAVCYGVNFVLILIQSTWEQAFGECAVLSCINSCVWYDSKIIDMCDMYQKSNFFITSPFRGVQKYLPTIYAIFYSDYRKWQVLYKFAK